MRLDIMEDVVALYSFVLTRLFEGEFINTKKGRHKNF